MGLPRLQHLESFIDLVGQRQDTAETFGHRYLIVLSGDRSWACGLINAARSALNGESLLLVSAESSQFSFEVIKSKASQIKRHLGGEFDHLIWDGFSGLHPDGIGAASGLIKGGGLFFLLIPPLDSFTSNPDPDYVRMCNSESELECYGTNFLKHLLNSIQEDPKVQLIEASKPFPILETNNKSAPSAHPLTLPTQDQLRVIEAIKKVARGRAKRPLVITADRGRGKSTSLGLAAAELLREQNRKIVITGPSEAACSTAIRHFKWASSEVAELDFSPPDELIIQHPEVDLLLVDEAASIPSPLLIKLLVKFKRVVFATTIHGYEGTGKGFAIRFQKTLDTVTPQWKGIEMRQPIRWADDDPLEAWTFKALCLDAEAAEIGKEQTFQNVELSWRTGEELIGNQTRLRQTFGLLVNAHYQTSPSDLRMLLDHPDINVGLLETEDTVIAVVLVIKEGGIKDKVLAKGIISGERKPRNHLVPQALTYGTANSDFMTMSTLRIMRIAVHPELQRQGLGSKLLREVESHAREQDIDYLSSSFGLTPELLRFWHINAYDLVRVGRHKDAASGTESVIVAKAIKADVKQILEETKYSLSRYFDLALPAHYRTMDPFSVWPAFKHTSGFVPKKLNKLVIQSVIEGHRGIEDSLVELFDLLKVYVVSSYGQDDLDEQHVQALVIKILQRRSWNTLVFNLDLSGKAEAASLLRESIRRVYEAVNLP